MANQANVEQEIEALYNASFQNLLRLWDGKPVLHAYYYTGDADDDDHHAAADHTSELLAAEAAIDAASCVLDIGCGCGSFLFYIAKRYGCSCVGVDLSEEHIKFARDKLVDEDVRNVEFRHGSATQLPYEAESFTHIVSQDALYLVPDKPSSHAEIHRVLQPGGILAFCDFLQPTKEISEHARTRVYNRLRYNNGYSIEEYQRVLELAGFEILLCRNLHSHFLKTYRALAKKARARANEMPDDATRRLMLYYCGSCIEIHNTIACGELGWGMFIARKRPRNPAPHSPAPPFEARVDSGGEARRWSCDCPDRRVSTAIVQRR